MSLASTSHLSRLTDAAHDAIGRVGARTHSFELADRTIRLIGAGPELVDRIAPAFAHLPARGERVEADLTVLLWDSRSTGVALPDLAPTRLTIGDPVTPILADADRSFVFHAFEGAVSYLDRPGRTAVYAVEDAGRLPPWERACPLRALLTWWFLPRGLLLLHGAAVGHADGVVLLAGPGGAGKSTTALACLAAGMGYLGDDYVLVDPSPVGAATPTVWSVYGSAKLAPEHLARFPGLLTAEPPAPGDPPDAKAVGWPARSRPDSVVTRAPLRAIALPLVAGGPTSTLVPVPASRALLAIAPPTMFQTPGDRPATFRLASELSQQVPSHRLELGTDVRALPALLHALLPEAAPIGP